MIADGESYSYIALVITLESLTEQSNLAVCKNFQTLNGLCLSRLQTQKPANYQYRNIHVLFYSYFKSINSNPNWQLVYEDLYTCNPQIKSKFQNKNIWLFFRYNRLLNVIHQSLKDLQKAIKGLVVMSQQLEDMSNSIFINAVPTMWSGKVRDGFGILEQYPKWIVKTENLKYCLSLDLFEISWYHIYFLSFMNLSMFSIFIILKKKMPTAISLMGS